MTNGRAVWGVGVGRVGDGLMKGGKLQCGEGGKRGFGDVVKVLGMSGMGVKDKGEMG